jgi:Integrase zinc binding domain
MNGIYAESLKGLDKEMDMGIRKNLMDRAHSMGHLGAADMARSIQSSKRLSWPNIVRDCQDCVSACLPSQQALSIHFHSLGVMGRGKPSISIAKLFSNSCRKDSTAEAFSGLSSKYFNDFGSARTISFWESIRILIINLKWPT